jgi:hypothetical protein
VGSTLSSAQPKSVVTLSFAGSSQLAAVFTYGGTQVRGATALGSDAGSWFWVATSFGVAAVPRGANGTEAVAVTSTATSYRGIIEAGGLLYAAPVTSSAAQLLGGVGAVPGSPPTASPAPAPFALPSVASGGSGTAFVWFETPLTLWTLDNANAWATLIKWTRATASPSAAWARASSKWFINTTALDGTPVSLVAGAP